MQQRHLAVQRCRAAYSSLGGAPGKGGCKVLILLPIDAIPIFTATSIHVTQMKQAMNSKFCLREK